MSLPVDPKQRKSLPIARGVLDYFPDAIAAVADLSRVGNEQHNPGQPLHWAREKSTDHADCIARHLIERGTVDIDGVRHSAKLAWRALALLQTEIEAERSPDPAAPVNVTKLREPGKIIVLRGSERLSDVALQQEPEAGNRRTDADLLQGVRAMRGAGGV